MEQEWKDKWEQIYAEELLEYTKYKQDKAYSLGENQPEFFIEWLYPFRKITKQDTVLELGCGHGHWIFNLYDKVKEIHGTDISKSAIDEAKRFFREEKNVILYEETDLLNIFKKNQFDIIYSITVFQHIPKWQTLKYFEQAYQVLKEDGVFFFNVFRGCSITSKDAVIDDLDINKHVPCVGFTFEELEQDLKNVGFKNINIRFMKVEHNDENCGWYLAIVKK